jgi:nucleotide-binding universal stress UspA family protein
MRAPTGRPVVVGIDGSERCLAAVRVAAREAAIHGRALRVVHAFVWPTLGVRVGPPAGGPPDAGLRHHAERLLAEAVTEAAKAEPEVTVTSVLADGAAVPVLLRESREAYLLVLGDRGLGGFTGLLVGSVAVQAVAHAACPVLVVRGRDASSGPVVVGVDGSALSLLAVEFAAAEAEARGTDLVAVHVWLHPVSTGPGDMLPLVYDPDRPQAEERLVLAQSLAGLAQRHPDLRIRPELVHGHPARCLIEWSKAAQLMIVGSRGKGGFAGLLLGSVSQSLVHHADCPIAVVRRTPHSRPTPAARTTWPANG